MQPRGKEYLEDGSEALKLQIQELEKMRAQNIQLLTHQQDNLYARGLEAQDLGKTIPNYQRDYDLLTRAIQTEKQKSLEDYARELKIPLDQIRSKQPALGGLRQIQQKLGIANNDLKDQPKAKAIRRFTVEEMKKINDHHGKLEPNLQKLMDAAIGDDQFNFEFIANPVFIPRDGHVYDRTVLDEFLERKQGKATCPLNQDISFTAADITPCNTLIRATEQLLHIIETEGKVDPVKVKTQYATLEQKANRQRIPEKLIPIIEAYYTKMPDKHKVLFDIVCRDPVSGSIMDDPVLLPDGYVYDRTIAMYLLNKEGGVCRLNPDIRFTEKDITPCHFVVKVLLQLKENIEEALAARQKAAQQQGMQQPNQQPGIQQPQQIVFHNDDQVSQKEFLQNQEANLVRQIEAMQKQLVVVRRQLADLDAPKPLQQGKR